jgi:transcriptional regulator with XRE-family HTH domain
MSNNNHLPNIGENIKKIRKEIGISRDRLSKRADLSLNTIVNVETGVSPNPTLDTIWRIAKALNTTIDNLVRDDKVQ